MSAPAVSAPTVGEVLIAARRRLARAPFEPSTREAGLLLAHVLGRPEASLFAHPEERLPVAAAARFERLLERRLGGEPVAYLTGRREFFGRWFEVDQRVLIPRPESEHLIEATLELGLPGKARILDIGTGSGCLALTLALELPAATLTATDRSVAALAVAARNRRRLDLEHRVRLAAADLATGLDVGAFDAVVSNPPYVDPSERSEISLEVSAFEPAEALFPPPGSPGLLARLLAGLDRLGTGTPVLLEIGRGQEEHLLELLRTLPFDLERLLPDYAGIPRVAQLRRAAG